MTVTSKPGKGNKVHVHIDGEYVLTVYDTFWYSAGFAENSEITEDELASLKREAGFRSSLERGLSILSRRSHSEKELREKLLRLSDRESVDAAVEKLRELGYIDDEGFAREYAAYLSEKKGMGARRVEYELKMKGIDGDTVKKIAETLDNDPVMRIIILLRNKYGKSLDTEKGRARVRAALVRLGYSHGDITRAVREFAPEADYSEGEEQHYGD